MRQGRSIELLHSRRRTLTWAPNNLAPRSTFTPTYATARPPLPYAIDINNMGLRDLLKKKQGLDDGDGPDPATVKRLAAPEFTFVRSDTYTEEVIHPPGGADSDAGSGHLTIDSKGGKDKSRLSLDVFRSSGGRSRSSSVTSSRSTGAGTGTARRLSQRLHLSRSPVSSDNVPQNLPQIIAPDDPEEDKEGQESQWEKRATILARENEKNRSRPHSPSRDVSQSLASMRLHDGSSDDAPPNWPLAGPSGPKKGVVSSKETDEMIQEAIRLHEEGDLERSTALFGQLADPKGANNPLSQVLYGLALRYVPPPCNIVKDAHLVCSELVLPQQLDKEWTTPAKCHGYSASRRGWQGLVALRDASYGGGNGHATVPIVQ